MREHVWVGRGGAEEAPRAIGGPSGGVARDGRGPRPAHRAGGLAAACLAAAATAVGAAADVPSWHQATMATFGWGMFEPSVSADGRSIAFRSAFNFVGENADVNFEIFLYDAVDGTISQVTHTSTFFGNFEPKITPDGSAIIFRSLYNFVGTNADGSFELFEHTVATGAVKQLTFTPGSATVSSGRLSADGTTVVFLSNFDGTNDVMRYRRDTGVLSSVTNLPSGCIVSNPSVSADGSAVAFRSNHNIGGQNPDFSFEIWRWSLRDGTTAVTSTTQLCELPAIDGTGRFVAFLGRGNFTGENPTFNRELFIADTLRGSFDQATPSLNVGKHLEPVFSADGSFLVFESDRDPVGLNPDKNRELFRYDLARGELTQQTVTTGGVSIGGLSEPAAANYVAIAADGGHLAYRNEHLLDPSSGDPAPEVNLEIFLATLPEPPPPGDLNGDGLVDESDLAICLGAWGSDDPIADLSGDGTVDLVDVSILLGSWTTGSP